MITNKSAGKNGDKPHEFFVKINIPNIQNQKYGPSLPLLHEIKKEEFH